MSNGTQGTSVPIRSSRLDRFDFLLIVALNVGNFGKGKDRPTREKPPDLYVFPHQMVTRRFVDKRWVSKTGKFLFKMLKGPSDTRAIGPSN